MGKEEEKEAAKHLESFCLTYLLFHVGVEASCGDG